MMDVVILVLFYATNSNLPHSLIYEKQGLSTKWKMSGEYAFMGNIFFL